MISWVGYDPKGTPKKPVVATEPGVLGRDFNWCEKPDCERLVYVGTLYCCTACSHAGEHKYEIEEHGTDCDTRWASRKDLVPEGRFHG